MFSQEESHAHQQLVRLHRRKFDGFVQAVPLLWNDGPGSLGHRGLLWSVLHSSNPITARSLNKHIVPFARLRFIVSLFCFVWWCRISLRFDADVCGWDCSNQPAGGAGHAAPVGDSHWDSDSTGTGHHAFFLKMDFYFYFQHTSSHPNQYSRKGQVFYTRWRRGRPLFIPQLGNLHHYSSKTAAKKQYSAWRSRII